MAIMKINMFNTIPLIKVIQTVTSPSENTTFYLKVLYKSFAFVKLFYLFFFFFV